MELIPKLSYANDVHDVSCVSSNISVDRMCKISVFDRRGSY
jgi:hypothetical protein